MSVHSPRLGLAHCVWSRPWIAPKAALTLPHFPFSTQSRSQSQRSSTSMPKTKISLPKMKTRIRLPLRLHLSLWLLQLPLRFSSSFQLPLRFSSSFQLPLLLLSRNLSQSSTRGPSLRQKSLSPSLSHRKVLPETPLQTVSMTIQRPCLELLSATTLLWVSPKRKLSHAPRPRTNYQHL